MDSICKVLCCVLRGTYVTRLLPGHDHTQRFAREVRHALSCSSVSHAQLPVLKAAKLGDAVGKVAANGDIQQARL